MDLIKIFESISVQLIAEFTKSSQINHSGGKGGVREDAFKSFLSEYLPNRYGIGRGEVISSGNYVSGELDVVIFDKERSPLFIRSESHSIYPVESVYGAISIKSHLDSSELKDAYQNIVSFRKMVPRGHFSLKQIPGVSVGMSKPVPLSGILAYASNRSLEAIAKQVSELDKDLEDLFYRPDFVAVIGKGIIGPREKLRAGGNEFKLPTKENEICLLRKTGRHTLLRLYMQMLSELNAINLVPLDMEEYWNMPKLIGPYRVKKHYRFASTHIESGEEKVRRLNHKAIEEIVRNSKPVSVKQHFLNYVGSLPVGIEKMGYDLNEVIFEYNPENLPPVTSSPIIVDNQGRHLARDSVFQPIFLVIDGNQYAVDMKNLGEDMFDDDPDFTIDELFST